MVFEIEPNRIISFPLLPAKPYYTVAAQPSSSGRACRSSTGERDFCIHWDTHSLPSVFATRKNRKMRLAKYFLRLAFTHIATGENKKCGLQKIFCKPHFSGFKVQVPSSRFGVTETPPLLITINSACLPDKYGRQAESIVQKNAILSTEECILTASSLHSLISSTN